MRLKVTLHTRDGSAADVAITVDGDSTVGDVALAIAKVDRTAGSVVERPTLARPAATGGAQVLARSMVISEAGIRSGTDIAVVPSGDTNDPSGPAVAVLTVHSGPDAGRSFNLRAGQNIVGRGRDANVVLTDRLVSAVHARVNVGELIEIVDENSSNGILLGGELVPRVELRSGDRVTLGNSVVSIARSASAAGPAVVPQTAIIDFNRSPRVDPPYEGEQLVAPEPPSPPSPQRFPVIPALTPLVLGGALIVVTKSLMSVVFIALSPLMLVGTWWENRRAGQRAFAEATEHFRNNLADLVVDLRRAHEYEQARRCVEHPGTAEVAAAIDQLQPLVWTRRPEHRSFMEIRLGIGRQPSRTTVETSGTRNSTPALQAELGQVLAEFSIVDRVPVVASFDQSGSVGVSGPDEAMMSVARGLLIQLVGLHSPAELVVAGVASARTAPRWDWIKWLPHTASDHSPISGDHLASTAPRCEYVVDALEEIIALRAEERRDDDSISLPRVLLVVENDSPIARSRLVQLAERGPAVGVHLLWVASSTPQIPAACRSYIEVDHRSGHASTGRVVEGDLTTPVLIEPLDASNSGAIARRLAPVVDAGIAADAVSEIPVTVSFLREAGIELIESPGAVLDRWRETNSVMTPGQPAQRLKRDNTLRALVGRGATDALHLDLRTHGPHALVGGTTGAGKSEFLQTWILGMASSHGPQRVTFLFVDYKGGAAFADCVSLPHTVGLVTDLSPHLVRRALTSLNAELRHREHVLNRKKAKDLLELERRGDPEAPPSLVIVVDEFAALVQEVPEFVDGVVNVAQRGRSLGLHLILATQRPAGVIKDNLRANTNLRVALRMADEDDSVDVVGTAQAASFDPSLPGRAIAKLGPGRLTPFQAGYVGGWTSREVAAAPVRVESLRFGVADVWEAPEEPAGRVEEHPGPTDIQRLVANISEAYDQLALPPPRKPWLPELAACYDLAALPTRRTDDELVWGVADDPAEQNQPTVSLSPDSVGNMAVFGTGGSGKSAFLRSVAIAAGLTARGGPCYVYGLDFGARGLQMLEPLPHVGSIVAADDQERLGRLLRQLRETVDERAVRYAAAKAGSVAEYRRLANRPDEPRVLVLVDGFGAFRTAYEGGPQSRLFDLFQSIAVDGRPVGVHLVVSADRPGAIPAALSSAVQQRLVLRMPNEMDLGMLNAPLDGFDASSPPGRGFVDGREVQVAVLGGSANVAEQAAAIERLAESMRRAGTVGAPAIERLAEDIHLDTLVPTVGGRPTIGVADETLSEVGFDRTGVFLVVGPAGSGKSTAVATAVASLRRVDPGAVFAYLGNRRSPLAAMPGWAWSARGAEEAATLSDTLAGLVNDEAPEVGRMVLVVDGIGDFLNGSADFAMQELIKACRAHDLLVIAESETSSIQGSWPLLQAVKSARHGIALQPDQMDGDTVFNTTFTRLNRADFPPGRGMYVRAGRATKVQVAHV